MTNNSKFILNGEIVQLTGRVAERKRRNKTEYLVEVSSLPDTTNPFEKPTLTWVRPAELFIVKEPNSDFTAQDCFNNK